MLNSCRAVTLQLFLAAMLGLLPTGHAAAQDTPDAIASDAIERVQEALNRTPAQSLRFDAKMPVPVATFRVTVSQRAFVTPILDSLRKEFELTPLQRQSADWASKCCGISLATLTDGLDRAIRRMQERRARERVARELAEVIAAANK